MAFKMNGFNPGNGTGMGGNSPLNKNAPYDKAGSDGKKKMKPRKGETYRQWLNRSMPTAKHDYHGPRKVWNGKKWVKDERDTKTVIKDNVKNIGDDLLNLMK